MKTLVIHPKDSTTDFLSVIYADKKEWTIINYNPSKTELKKKIKEHDRIVMLGHGTEYGLILTQQNNHPRLIIDSDWVYLLREKQCVCIWCNADIFVRQYGLKGFYTGMIISEYDEALLYSLHEFNQGQISESNSLFADCVKKSIHIEDENILLSMVASYKSENNPIINFNSDNMYFKN